MAAHSDWRFDRAVARVEPAVEQVVADFATSYVGRPVERRIVRPPLPLPGVSWFIDGVLVVEYVYLASGRDEVIVHDVALLDPLKKRLRTGHVEVSYEASKEWMCE